LKGNLKIYTSQNQKLFFLVPVSKIGKAFSGGILEKLAEMGGVVESQLIGDLLHSDP
jgi:hypothetical protein